ncbi:mannitol dehydrogenase family protein [Chromohalobacter canadensis]|uniref:Mannitol dehydrogenase n=1 Tax=Chromohalobacter canadensis TaxID=141389 RepID=A0ABZ0YBL9_9GAMM|nr:mannitol dehydrogenase [Chromohalobacter canadensis]MCK0769418.1 mannitol dehydrogenase [Chromohalobacter canadensis]WQH08989.1 mannitol dehydrogenase [Chromohalobacter canadensis]
MTAPTLADAGIVQFGTSRFLLGHVAAFVHASREAGHTRDGILVVQTSPREAGKQKARDLDTHREYPLAIRGRRDGRDIDTRETITSVAGCLIADEQWEPLERHFVEHARFVVSNTGDSGYHVDDDSALAEVPKSFPGKLTKLLHARYSAGREGLTVLPCELVSRNGEQLQALVLELAQRDYADADFDTWLTTRCLWANTLVDRIVSAALEPVGAVAEPYALWAIEDQPGLELPCQHPDVQCVTSLAPYEMRKLHILNLAHTYLVHRWQREPQPRIRFVREAMDDPAWAEELRQVLDDEVLPTLAEHLERPSLEAYRDATLERFANPYLDHALQDIAQHHAMKCQRRLQPVVESARRRGVATPRLDDAISSAQSTTHSQ